MADRVSFTVYGTAAPAGSKTTGARKDGARFVRDSSKRAAPWKLQVADAAGKAMDGAPLMDGALHLQAIFHVPRPKGHHGARGLEYSRCVSPEVGAVRLLVARLEHRHRRFIRVHYRVAQH